jgi:hypothetical protein
VPSRSPWPTLEALCHDGLARYLERLNSRRLGSLHDPISYGYFDVRLKPQEL